MAQQNLPPFLSEKEAAAYLSVSLSTIRRWRRAKTGPAYFLFGGILRYPMDAVDAFIGTNTQPPA